MEGTICRLCLAEMSEEFVKNKQFINKVKTYLKIKLTNSDRCCSSCMEKVEKFDLFYEMVQENDKKFTQLLSKMNKMRKSRRLEERKTRIKKPKEEKQEEDGNEKTLKGIEGETEKQQEEINSKTIMNNLYEELCIERIGEHESDNLESSLKIEEEEVREEKYNNAEDFNHSEELLMFDPEIKLYENVKEEKVKSRKKYKKYSHDEPYKSDTDEDYVESESIESDDELFDENEIKVEEDETDDENKTFKLPKNVVKNYKFQMRINKLEPYMLRFFRVVCDICTENEEQQKFPTIPSLLKHYEDIHNTKGYIICCDKKFFSLKRIMLHFGYHCNPEEYTCRECNLVLNDPATLKHHRLKHTPGAKPEYHCSQCPKVFSTPRGLRVHRFEFHHALDALPTHKCDKCDKAYYCSTRLKRHLYDAHSNKKRVCDVCGKTFNLKSSLKNHLIIHQNPNYVQCEHCQKWFKNQLRLKCHIRELHSPARVLLKCELCDYNTFDIKCFRIHMKCSHSNEKPYSCPYCDLTFKIQSSLRSHIARHMGITKKCDFCSKEFSSKGGYYKHTRKFHARELIEKRIQKPKEEEEEEDAEDFVSFN